MVNNKIAYQWEEYLITDIMAFHSQNCPRSNISVELISEGSRFFKICD